jgi:hypothetical protein
MQTSRFQLSLTTGLAVALGAALTWGLGASDAIGYPAGPAISYGSNPTFSFGGGAGDGFSLTALTAPAGQVAMVTDVVLTASGSSGSSGCTSTMTLLAGGVTIGSFRITSNTSSYSSSFGLDGVSHAFNSGMPVAPGDSLEVGVSGSCSIQYTLSGYYAEA